MGYRRGQVSAERQVLRGLADRLRRLENRRTLSVGPWSLTVDDETGELVLRHRPSGYRQVLAVPPVTDEEPSRDVD